jgi:hypothetical protein
VFFLFFGFGFKSVKFVMQNIYRNSKRKKGQLARQVGGELSKYIVIRFVSFFDNGDEKGVGTGKGRRCASARCNLLGRTRVPSVTRHD